MLITDQVATAPCTDPIQVRFLLLRQSLSLLFIRLFVFANGYNCRGGRPPIQFYSTLLAKYPLSIAAVDNRI